MKTTITTGNSGSGTGAVSYSVAANAGTDSRTGTLTVAGQTSAPNGLYIYRIKAGDFQHAKKLALIQ